MLDDQVGSGRVGSGLRVKNPDPVPSLHYILYVDGSADFHRYATTVYDVALCLSVRLSVYHKSSKFDQNVAKQKITQTTHYGIHEKTFPKK